MLMGVDSFCLPRAVAEPLSPSRHCEGGIGSEAIYRWLARRLEVPSHPRTHLNLSLDLVDLNIASVPRTAPTRHSPTVSTEHFTGPP